MENIHSMEIDDNNLNELPVFNMFDDPDDSADLTSETEDSTEMDIDSEHFNVFEYMNRLMEESLRNIAAQRGMTYEELIQMMADAREREELNMDPFGEGGDE